MPATCGYGNHEVPGVDCNGALYCYSDPKNGITRDVIICKECLFDHVHFHYPGCPTEQHLLQMCPELGERMKQEAPEPKGQLALFE